MSAWFISLNEECDSQTLSAMSYTEQNNNNNNKNNDNINGMCGFMETLPAW